MTPYKDENYDNARFTTKPLKPLTDQGGRIFFIYFPWDTSNASVALSSHCTQHSLRLTGFDLWLIKVAEFKWFLRYLITELTLLDKHRRGTVVNQALPSLHEGLLKITILVPLNLPKVQWCRINSIHGFWITPLLLLSFI